MADPKSHRMGGQRQDLRKSDALAAWRRAGSRTASGLRRNVLVALSGRAARSAWHDHARRLWPYQASPAGLSWRSVAGRCRDVPHDSEFSGCPVLGRLREGLMSLLGEQAVFVPARRFADRAYLAWATVAIAYAIAFLQRVSPQSASLNFIHDFSTAAAASALLPSSYF